MQITMDTALAIYDETLNCFLDEKGYQYSYPNDNIIYSDGKKIDSIKLRNTISDLRKCNYSDHNIYVVRVRFKCEFSKSNLHNNKEEDSILTYRRFIHNLYKVHGKDVSQSKIEKLLKDYKSYKEECEDEQAYEITVLNIKYLKRYLQENFYNKKQDENKD